MKTRLLSDSDIRNNVSQALPGGLFAALVLGLGSAMVLGLVPNVFGTNLVNLMGEALGFGVVGVAALALSILWYMLLYRIEYVAATKYSAELKDGQLEVIGRSGRSVKFSPDDIKRIHFSGEYSAILKGALVIRRDRKDFDNVFRAQLSIVDIRKKYRFGPFFLSVDPNSFASIVHELTLLNPSIEVT